MIGIQRGIILRGFIGGDGKMEKGKEKRENEKVKSEK
jgi:hypothetical protein